MAKTELPVPDDTWREYEFVIQLPPSDDVEEHNAFMLAITQLAERFGGYIGGGQTGPLEKPARKPRTRYRVREYARFESNAPALDPEQLMTQKDAAAKLDITLSHLSNMVERRKWRVALDTHEPHPNKRVRLFKTDVQAEARRLKRRASAVQEDA